MRLAQTSNACPEQYEVLDKHDNIVGYLRLRNGVFSARYPDAGGDIVYEPYPNGDGIFEAEERDYYIANAIEAIQKHMQEKKPDVFETSAQRLQKLLSDERF